ncbi:GNAT family N-acetyltransferase [Mycobacteroides salmoniphilum]|uniref:N-acetyltransferase domain-containing protein n=1 Tax=Mycobacteroides salmoniphilum TaxID=404941 RepID=A0A4R8SIH0_9MYCO|nr:GNAT family N-acetyltransferase [Mycobacteroides salmoniphilum]TDZ96803.1 hypothetical protein CCUG60885_02947 [Mycobacteroides salmoniphilum]TEA05898.1 hypothetical protein CCUG60883_03204 [Mycobacteroides salmoniphilum]
MRNQRLGVPLQLVDLRPTASDERWWAPLFCLDMEYQHPHWWTQQNYGNETPWYVQVLENGIEVARVELDDPGCINPAYVNSPELGDARLEIQFIEVATAARGRGVGTRVVRSLMERHSDRRLFAYSVDADKFWTCLGWEPFYDPRPGPPGSPLFVQPAGGLRNPG